MTTRKLSFAIFPFIHVTSPVQFGPYVLWKNAPSEWNKYLGSDESAFTRMYRGRDGEPVEDSASILSRTDGAESSYEQWLDAAACLSTAAWLTDPLLPDADPWLFEAWSIPAGEHDFVRVGKFSRNLTDSEFDRLYPTPYTHSRTFNAYSAQDALKYFGSRLDRSNKDSRALLTALGHLYRVRRGAPYFTSAFDDVEAIWSALEAFSQLGRDTTFLDDRPLTQWARRYLPPALLRRVNWDPGKRLTRCEEVARFLRTDLATLGLVDATWRHIVTILAELYSIRSEFTHGGSPERARLLSGVHGAGLIEMSLFLWQTVLQLRVADGNIFTAGHLAQSLVDILHEKEVHDGLIEIVRSTKRNDWFDAASPHTGSELHKRARDVASSLRHVSTVTGRYRGSPAARHAKKTLTLALSEWLKYLGPATSGFPPTDGLHARLTDFINTYKPDADRIELEFAKELVRRGATEPSPPGEAQQEPLLCGSLPLSDLALLFVRLESLYVGYNVERY